MAWPSRATRLALVGRFLPPTNADEVVLAFAAVATDVPITVAVLSHPADRIGANRRLAWLREMAPTGNVIELPMSMPLETEAGDDAAAGAIGSLHEVATRLRVVADAVVGPGLRDRWLAQQSSLPYVPVDVPWFQPSDISFDHVSAGVWPHLAIPVRASLSKRVVIVGPESTGKTTLAADLARHYNTVWVGEYLRLWLDAKGGMCEPHDLMPVVIGQRASEEALARHANRVLLSDSDPLMTAVYSRFYYGELPSWLDEAASARRADVYLLLDCDVPWVHDPYRDAPHRRHEIRDMCRDELERRALPWHLVRGTWSDRFATACRVMDGLLG